VPTTGRRAVNRDAGVTVGPGLTVGGEAAVSGPVMSPGDKEIIPIS
jgi:hypothetical protein